MEGLLSFCTALRKRLVDQTRRVARGLGFGGLAILVALALGGCEMLCPPPL